MKKDGTGYEPDVGLSNPCYGHTCVSASAYQWLAAPMVVDKFISAINVAGESEESLRNPGALCNAPGCGEAMYPFRMSAVLFLKIVCSNDSSSCCIYVKHGWGVTERVKHVCVDPSASPTWSRIGVMRHPIRIRYLFCDIIAIPS